jgi:hypothetical protein
MSHGEVDCCSSVVTPASIVSAPASAGPHWPTPALWNSKEYFLDCLVAALEVRRTTEDDGITACFVSPQAFKKHWFIMQRMRKNMEDNSGNASSSTLVFFN